MPKDEFRKNRFMYAAHTELKVHDRIVLACDKFGAVVRADGVGICAHIEVVEQSAPAVDDILFD